MGEVDAMIEIALLLTLWLLMSDANAQNTMPKSPFDLAQLATYAWVVVISFLGGAAAFVRKIRAGQARPFNLVEFFGEIVVSAFAGIVTYWFCRWAELNEWASAAFVGIGAHMGSRAIFMGEQVLERLYQKFMNGPSHQ
jgi:hypothetical protein